MKKIVSGMLAMLSAGSVVGCARAVPPDDAKTFPKGGAQLWAETCIRCHNSRSPSSYSDGEWDAIVFHMRVRGNLTAGEARSITEFLKSAN